MAENDTYRFEIRFVPISRRERFRRAWRAIWRALTPAPKVYQTMETGSDGWIEVDAES